MGGNFTKKDSAAILQQAYDKGFQYEKEYMGCSSVSLRQSRTFFRFGMTMYSGQPAVLRAALDCAGTGAAGRIREVRWFSARSTGGPGRTSWIQARPAGGVLNSPRTHDKFIGA